MTSMNKNTIINVKHYYKDFFIDINRISNGLDYNVTSADTFSIINNEWKILKYGKWYTYLSLAPHKKLKYPCSVYGDEVIFCENKINSVYEINGKTIVDFELKEGENQIYSSTDYVPKIILFDFSIGIIKITHGSYTINLSSINYKFQK